MKRFSNWPTSLSAYMFWVVLSYALSVCFYVWYTLICDTAIGDSAHVLLSLSHQIQARDFIVWCVCYHAWCGAYDTPHAATHTHTVNRNSIVMFSIWNGKYAAQQWWWWQSKKTKYKKPVAVFPVRKMVFSFAFSLFANESELSSSKQQFVCLPWNFSLFVKMAFEKKENRLVDNNIFLRVLARLSLVSNQKPAANVRFTDNSFELISKTQKFYSISIYMSFRLFVINAYNGLGPGFASATAKITDSSLASLIINNDNIQLSCLRKQENKNNWSQLTKIMIDGAFWCIPYFI